MTARKLRVVPNCPQPEPPPYRPIQYGWLGGHKAERLPPSPLPHEANIIARVQSMRTRNGVRAEPLSYEASMQYLRNVQRVKRHNVTVPRPLMRTLAGTPDDSPSRSAGEGSHHPQRDPAARVGTPADASPNPAPVGVQATGDLSGE